MKSSRIIFATYLFSLMLSSCYSVFSGGTGGTVVDSESTNTPKDGIAYVDVYAYTSAEERDADFNSYKEEEKFSPSASYYGHTSTGTDGSFTLSKIVWKNYKPVFGKDADVNVVYLLFYHENYGLTKGSTLIVSDSTSNTVYQELTKTRKTTALNLSFVDAASENSTNQSVYVTISVPQKTQISTEAKEKKYEANITGNGTVTISYPRWKDKERTLENTVEVTVQYYQSTEENEIIWKACRVPTEDGTITDYAFLEDGFSIKKEIPHRDNYSLTFFGKRCRFGFPQFSGQYKVSGDETDDGKTVGVSITEINGVILPAQIDGGVVTTGSQSTNATDGREKHGVFSNLGSGSWVDRTYEGKFTTAKVLFTVDGNPSASQSLEEIRSDVSSYTVQLN